MPTNAHFPLLAECSLLNRRALAVKGMMTFTVSNVCRTSIGGRGQAVHYSLVILSLSVTRKPEQE